MYILAAILETNDYNDGQILNLRICNCRFCNPWPRKCMFRHQDFFPRELETEILKHVYSGGHFEKWPPLRSKVKFAYLLLSFL